MYYAIVKSQVKKSFQMINERRFDELVKSLSANIRHSFAGNHALGGVRNDRVSVNKWFTRIITILPDLVLTVNDVKVTGWPNKTTAIVRWTATATLKNGDPYLNKGVHFIILKWGKVVDMEVYEDTLVVYNGLEKQYAAGIKEAKEPQIVS